MEIHSVIAPFLERRIKPRMECDYPVIIQGREIGGTKFKEKGRVINLSRNGMFVLLDEAIPDCVEVSVQIILFTGCEEFQSSKLATTGTVVRRENIYDEAFGIAIKFQRFRIL